MEAGVALNPFLLLGKVPRRAAMSCSGFCVCACALVGDHYKEVSSGLRVRKPPVCGHLVASEKDLTTPRHSAVGPP